MTNVSKAVIERSQNRLLVELQVSNPTSFLQAL